MQTGRRRGPVAGGAMAGGSPPGGPHPGRSFFENPTDIRVGSSGGWEPARRLPGPPTGQNGRPRMPQDGRSGCRPARDTPAGGPLPLMQNLRACAPHGTRCLAGGGGLVIAARPAGRWYGW
jgi:hypothetical protein